MGWPVIEIKKQTRKGNDRLINVNQHSKFLKNGVKEYCSQVPFSSSSFFLLFLFSLSPSLPIFFPFFSYFFSLADFYFL